MKQWFKIWCVKQNYDRIFFTQSVKISCLMEKNKGVIFNVRLMLLMYSALSFKIDLIS